MRLKKKILNRHFYLRTVNRNFVFLSRKSDQCEIQFLLLKKKAPRDEHYTNKQHFLFKKKKENDTLHCKYFRRVISQIFRRDTCQFLR